VKFPKRLRYRRQGKAWATIYKSDNPTQPYNLYWRVRVDGKPRSRFKSFSTYSAAKKAGDKIVADLATGALAATLSPGQASDARLALDTLNKFYVDTGKRVSLHEAAARFVAATRKLGDRLLSEAVEGYLRGVVTVKRKDLAEAVQDFAAAEKSRTVSPDGQRPELSPGFHRQKVKILEGFAQLFPGHAVSDLTKALVDTFFKHIREREDRPAIFPKSRNHHRTVVKQFLQWSVRNDYLQANHRLSESESMRPEKTNGAPTEFYTPTDFSKLLEAAEGEIGAMIAIGGLAGLRTAELLRLDWADVWRVRGHIEVTARKSKTRQRRLVEICPALAAWLRPFSKFPDGPLWKAGEHKFHKRFGRLCERAKVKREQNALRHSFCTYHFALHANENLTSQQAGNSPGMIHGHYKGLATRAETKQWFSTRPSKPVIAEVISFPVKSRNSS
jgi:integrase